MSWKKKSISICRRAISGQLFQNSNLKQSLNFGQKSVIKARQQSHDCCRSESKSLFDEATVPEGPWAEHYKRRDEKDTRILAAGVISFLITMAVVQKRGLVKGHPEISLFF
ncbi:uncharacterized protein LOC131666230 [Phymastichus coffea]|uniref:uncharacterized protein LOC131666230 n=1 Tax=Phymastichus coffea TaxID=108790 RepID=UPI00273C7415|nr:uncharacterized protein LOC131666230 [Phymastichus coffea]